jgi:hypothetical protein
MGTALVALTALVLSVVPLVAWAGTYEVTFGVTTGGPAPTGTFTFADPEPSDGVVAMTDFSFTDGTRTWTMADDQLFAYFHGGFTAGTLEFIAIKVMDTATGRSLELFSSGNPGDYQICTFADGSGACATFPPLTTGPFTFARMAPVPALGPWGMALAGMLLMGLGATWFARYRYRTSDA